MKKNWKTYCLWHKIENQKKRRYYSDVYSDDGIESDDKFSEIDDESNNEELSKRRKRLKKGRKL